MADFSSPPDRGEPYTDGLDPNEREVIARLAHLDERANALSNTVATLQASVGHLPSRTAFFGTFIAGLSILLATIALISVAYWNGVNGQFKGMSDRVDGKFEAVNTRIDGIHDKLNDISKILDRLSSQPVASPPSKHK